MALPVLATDSDDGQQQGDPPVPGPEEGVDRSEALLQELSKVLVKQKGLLHGSMQMLADRLETSAATAGRLLQVLGEISAQQQENTLKGVLRYIELRAKTGSLNARLFCQHVKHDETQLYLKANYAGHHSEDMLAKVHVIQMEWAAHLEITDTRSEPPVPLVLSGAYFPLLRITENTRAETMAALLRQTTSLPAEAAVFARRVRMLETDECGSNLKAEQMIRDESSAYLHTLCAAHKIHSVSAKAWVQFPDLHKGIVKTLRALRAPGHLQRFMLSLTRLVEEVEITSACLSQSAMEYRSKAIEAFSQTSQGQHVA